MTSDNHVAGTVSDAEIRQALEGIKPWASTLDKRDHLYRDLAVLVKVATAYLAMHKASPQLQSTEASAHSPDEIERVRQIILDCTDADTNDANYAAHQIAALQHPAKEMGE